MIKFFTSIFIILLFCSEFLFGQQPAFPTAEGAGKFTTGGRGPGSKVFAVTSLLDDGSAGTLRWALTQPATYRTVIFRVSGTIHLKSALRISNPNTTIAGQTAPGDGICIADYTTLIAADNIIIRYMRFRMGDRFQNKGKVNGAGADDALGDATNNHKNIIVDHCTASWSTDEALSLYGGNNLTIQWCFMTEPLNYSYHFETGDTDFEQHGYGGIWGGQNASFHHNLFAHCKSRMPRFNGSRYVNIVGYENADFRNNVIYNWSTYQTYGGEGGNYNDVNNYYKYGPNTPSNRRAIILQPYKQAAPVLPYGKFYLTGNYVDGYPNVTNNNWSGVNMNGGSVSDTILSKVTTEFPFLPVITQSAEDAYKLVLQQGGCSLPNRDTLDARIVNDVINRTGNIIDVQGGYPHGTAYVETVNAWPFLHSSTPPVDSDGDGMPDEWELQRGLNPNDPLDGNLYNGNGYTNLENYLNGDNIVASGTLNNCTNAKVLISSNSAQWLHASDMASEKLISTDTMNIVASMLDNGNYGAFSISYYATKTSRLNGRGIPYLNRNITIHPTDPSAIASPVSVRIYFTKAEYEALKLADNSITSLADLVIVKTDANECLESLSGDGTVITPTSSGVFGTYGTGYFLEFQTASFSTFFVMGKTWAPLPVNLLSFNAVAGNGIVNTNWKSSIEINCKNYVVERSADGRSFESIGVVDAKNSAGTNAYSFADMNPLNGISFYRLRITDKDGNEKYSAVVSVNFRKSNGLKVSPNPSKNSIKVSFEKAMRNGELKIISLSGKVMLSTPVMAGTTGITLDISSFTKGVYEVIYLDGDKRLMVKLMKQ